MSAARKLLQRTRVLLSAPERFVQGDLAKTRGGRAIDPHHGAACRFCTIGGLIRMLPPGPVSDRADYQEALLYLDHAAYQIIKREDLAHSRHDCVNVNDVLGHEHVLEMFDEAIERCPA